MSEQQTTDFAISNCGRLINLATFVDPIYVNNEKERWQNAPLQESNAHIERLWLLAIYPNTNLRSAIEWLNGVQQSTINVILPQNLPKFIRRNSVTCFFKIDKACKEIFAILPRFLKDLLQSKDLIRGAATRTKTVLTIFQFWFHYFSAVPFKAFGIYFFWQFEEWYHFKVCALLAIPFLKYRNNHTCLPISGSFAKLPRNLTHTRLPENFFSSQRFQHLGSDFIFTRSFSRFYPFSCRCYFCCSENFLLAKMRHFVCVTSRYLYRIQKIFKVFFP